MNFTGRLIVFLISVAATMVGTMWGAFEHLDSRMENKVLRGMGELRQERSILKDARDKQITDIHTKIKEGNDALSARFKSVEDKVDKVLIRYAKKKEEESDEEYATFSSESLNKSPGGQYDRSSEERHQRN